ncbi:MAG: SurA N-terminal domain-containing protein [Bacteriovoracaceae bacterium]|nr:SurA N-terminal domain-containing protein [Bacteriovoracaceae bacterium]
MKKTKENKSSLKATFQKRTSSIILSLIIGLVVISFVFGGLQSMRGTPDTVAKVGDHPIKIKEFERAYSQLVQSYSRMFGGKPLTSKQIEQMGIQKTVISRLINQKLIIVLAEKIGIRPSDHEIRETIKGIPNLKTNDQFDVSKYKTILRLNGWTPHEFEKMIRSDIKLKSAAGFLDTVPLSNGFIGDIGKFKSENIKVQMVAFSKNNMQKHIKVSKGEVNNFLKKKENVKDMENTFNRRKSEYDRPEQVKARHILIRVSEKTRIEAKKKIDAIYKKATPGNFKKLARKNTEDPSGKKTGGDLKWFARGTMDPAFEKVAFNTRPGTISKPVLSRFGQHIIYVEKIKKAYNATFEKHKFDIVKEHLQRKKRPELKKLVADLKNKIKKHLEKKQYRKIKKLEKEYGFQFIRDLFVNKLDGLPQKYNFDNQHLEKLFANPASKVHVFDDVITVSIIRTDVPSTKEKKDFEIDTNLEKETQNYTLRPKLNQDILKTLSEKVTIKDYKIIR